MYLLGIKTVKYRTLCFVMFAIVYYGDHIHYVYSSEAKATK